MATGLAGPVWTDTTVPWSESSYRYSVVARDACGDPGPREGAGDEVWARPLDLTPPVVQPPVLTRVGSCTVRVEAVATDACSGAEEYFRVDRDGSPRTHTTRLPYDDSIPGDGTYTYEVWGRDRAHNETWSPPEQITVSGCTDPGRCAYRAWSWDRDTSGTFRSPRAPNDLAFASPRDLPIDPCPFPPGEAVGNRDLELGAPDLVFYQVEGADVRDMRLVADRDPAVMSVRIHF